MAQLLPTAHNEPVASVKQLPSCHVTRNGVPAQVLSDRMYFLTIFGLVATPEYVREGLQATVDAAEYLPTAQAVHVEAPEPVSVSVTDPAGQAAQLVAVPTAVWAAT